MSDNGASAEGGANGLVQRAVLLQLRAREHRGEPAPHRRPRHAAGQQPLPLGLGVGRQHAAQAVQARHARGRRRRSAHRALAGAASAPTARRATSTCTRSTCMPTLLDLIGIEPPDVIAGVDADADRRRELRADVARRATRRARTSRSTTRCSAPGRCTTTAGRRWCSTRRRSSAYDGTDTRRAVRRRRVGAVPRRRGLLGGARPRRRASPSKLAELQAAVVGGGRASTRCCRSTTSPAASATAATAATATSSTAGSARSPKRSRRTSGTARSRSPPSSTSPTTGATDGVIVAHGSHAGGYVAYLAGPPAALRVQLRRHRDHDDRGNRGAPGRAGRGAHRLQRVPGERGGAVELFHDDVAVGGGNVPRTTLLTYGTPGFAVGYQPHSPIVGALPGRAEIPHERARPRRHRHAGPRPDS